MPTADRALFHGLLDDAAVFPPGCATLDRAVPDHLGHRRSAHRDLVGPLVLPESALDQLPQLTRGYAEGALQVSLTGVPVLRAAEVAASCGELAAVRLAAFELVVGELTAGQLSDQVCALGRALPGVELHVEVPRATAGYAEDLIAALADTPAMAKFRTGGVSADFYPGEAELAAAIRAVVRRGVPFKTTAGLHHAVRNTDGDREQHGFANLLWATAEAQAGGDVTAALAERDPAIVAARVGVLSPEVRRVFRSFGTCSISEPVEELTTLGLLAP